MTFLASLPLLSVWLLVIVDALAALLAIALIVLPHRAFTGAHSRPRRRRLRWTALAIAAIAGSTAGGALIWYIGDVQNAFGVSPTWVDRIWVGGVVAGVAVALVNLWSTAWRRKLLAVGSVFVFVLAGALAINRDGSVYHNLAQALGTEQVKPLTLRTHAPEPPTSTSIPLPAYATSTAFDPKLYATWKAPATMPKVGTVGSVRIPGTVSHFPARPAIVYLPPAALVAHPPALPVVVMLSGQPGEPGSLLASGGLAVTLDRLAKADRGLAPIVVIPDQLGSTSANPMCVDGKLGNSATYLADDVPTYIKAHFRVTTDRRAWAIGGFSQGGTCSIQLASSHPELFGSFVDVAGEHGPSLESRQATIVKGFGGSVAAYRAAQPTAIMAAHGRYADTLAFFAVGENDTEYGGAMTANSAAAAAAGMRVIRYISPHTAHDWLTATNGMAAGLSDLYPRLGLAAQPVD